ncbi:hypothetical protein TNCV_2154581 [Trichonephila clavipes]|nr:hypothetical protein TNCV_2154581 [Trichonephila clavipes]
MSFSGKLALAGEIIESMRCVPHNDVDMKMRIRRLRNSTESDFATASPVFRWNIRAMRWRGKVLEVRLMFSQPILNTAGTMHSCIIVHEVSVTIIAEMQKFKVHLIGQYI